MKIKTVTVIGANGTMGYNIAAIFAAFGNAKVFMISRNIQKSRNAIDKAVKSVRAESIRKNLIPCDYSQMGECICKSDLIFESVIENIEIKKEVTKQIGVYAKDDAIIATGTSGLSINEIGSFLPIIKRKNYYGMHFFNPPYSMSLVELIPHNEVKTITQIKEYLENTLLRTVVVCKDLPAFIANRIGFQFLNMALQYAEKYKLEGGVDYIDAIIGPFTGRAMTPCATVDFVGLDIHKAIVDNLFNNTNDFANETFKLPNYVSTMINNGRLGKKTNCGLFKVEIIDNDKKKKQVYDINSGMYVDVRSYTFEFIDKMNYYLKNGDYKLAFSVLKENNSKEAQICKEFLKDYIDYSLYVVNEVCTDITMVDDAMASGFNWCPPLALSNVLFGTNYPSKYDFRTFFRAVK